MNPRIRESCPFFALNGYGLNFEWKACNFCVIFIIFHFLVLYLLITLLTL